MDEELPDITCDQHIITPFSVARSVSMDTATRTDDDDDANENRSFSDFRN